MPKLATRLSREISVVGSGPNGLAAAITMAEAGYRVRVYEASLQAGGGTRTEARTLPGFLHDICSAVHPLAVSSPFFRSQSFERFGLEWIQPELPFAHPFGQNDDDIVEVHRSLEKTAAGLDVDEKAYLNLMRPLVENWDALVQEVLQPAFHVPRSPWLLMRFGLMAMMSATKFADHIFRGEKAKALFIGTAAHVNAPLDQAGTAAIALVLLGAAHTRGWPIPRGGSQSIANALIARLRELGGEIELGRPVQSLRDLPKCEAYFFDVVPPKLHRILEGAVSEERFRNFTSGPGVYKIDWALSAPIPWRNPRLACAGTLHIGGSAEEIVQSEAAPLDNRHPEKPYVLLSQPTLFDRSRAPVSQHVVWAYCHVPNGSKTSMVGAIEAQIERYAPGFRNLVLMKRCLDTAALEEKNPNLIGGDIAGGQFSLRNLLFPGPLAADPYRIGERFFICSSSTPPGPGVHGMCGYHAARSAIRALGKNV